MPSSLWMSWNIEHEIVPTVNGRYSMKSTYNIFSRNYMVLQFSFMSLWLRMASLYTPYNQRKIIQGGEFIFRFSRIELELPFLQKGCTEFGGQIRYNRENELSCFRRQDICKLIFRNFLKTAIFWNEDIRAVFSRSTYSGTTRILTLKLCNIHVLPLRCARRNVFQRVHFGKKLIFAIVPLRGLIDPWTRLHSFIHIC